MMHGNDRTVVSLIVTKHVFIISSRQAILTMPCTLNETTSLNTVTQGWCLSCLSAVPYTWWTLWGKKTPNPNNSKYTKNEHDFQCNWVISDRASFFFLLIGKKVIFLEVCVSGKENKDMVSCEWWIFLRFL